MPAGPIEIDWGNVADWASVAVTLFVGIVALRLTAAANRIADETHLSRLKSESRETKLAALALRSEMLATQSKISFALMILNSEHTLFHSDENVRREIMTLTRNLHIPELIKDFPTMARLPEEATRSASQAYASLDLIRTMATGIPEEFPMGAVGVVAETLFEKFDGADKEIEHALSALDPALR